MNGLTPVRTARLIAGLICFVDFIFFTIYEVLVFVMGLANNAVSAGLARYSNFTGRIAAENFAEDKQLLAMLKDAQGMLPAANVGLTILLIVVISLFLFSLFGFFLPRYFIAIFVKLKLLKWTDDAFAVDETSKLREMAAKVKKVKLRTLVIPIAVLVGLVVVIFIFVGLSKVLGASPEEIAVEMELKATEYVDAQKDFFKKNSRVGKASDLFLDAERETDAFKYQVGANHFTATSRLELNHCPEGSVWKISASSEGLFTKELKLYPKAPADTNCAKLLPDFKRIGKSRPKKTEE